MRSLKRIISRFRNKNEIATIAVEKERYYDQFVRTITPSMIKEYEDYIEIYSDADMVFATCIVAGVPPSQTGRGFPRNLPNDFTDQVLAIKANDCLIGVSYSFSPIAHEEATKLVDNALFNNKTSRYEIDKKTKEQTGTSAHSLRYDLEGNDYADLFNTIYNNESRLCDSQYIISLWSQSYEGLKNGISKVKGVMDTNIARMDIPYHRVREGFLAAQPYPILLESAEIQQISEDCGALIPLRNPLTALADTGIIYGLRKLDNAPFIVDFDGLAVGNHLVIGGTRSGKTVFLMKMMMALYDMLGIYVMYITVKPDTQTNFKGVAKYYKDKANIINIGVGVNNINPLQVLFNRNIKNRTDDKLIQSFNAHLDLVSAAFKVLDISDVTYNYVLQSILELYKRFGIIRKDPATWKNMQNDKWPVMQDLKEIWNEDAKDKNVSAIAILSRTTFFDTSCEYISQPTDVTFDKPLTVVDLSGVPAVLQDFMNVFVVGMVGLLYDPISMGNVNDIDVKKIVMIDEGRPFLQDKNLAEMIIRIFTRGGAAKLGAWFTTQQPSDAKDDDVKELLKNNSFGNIIMGNVKPASFDMLQSFFKLSEEDMGHLKGCGQGQGLIQINDTTTAVDFKLTDLEAQVILGQEKPGVIAPTGVGFEMMDNRLRALAEEHNAYFEDWIKGDAKQLSPGRDRYPIQRAFRSGTVGLWIKSSMAQNGKVMNQTIDHYGTVLQIASYLIHRGFSVEVNHHDDADIVATKDGHTIAIEYERPKSHTTDQLIEKNQRWQTKYGRVVFVVTSENYKQVSADNCIGPLKTVKRGAMLHEYIENYIYEINQETTNSEVV